MKRKIRNYKQGIFVITLLFFLVGCENGGGEKGIQVTFVTDSPEAAKVLETMGTAQKENLETHPGKFAPGDAPVLAHVGNEVITVGAFQREMLFRGGHIPGRFSAEEAKKGLLDEMIQFEVLAQKAMGKGYAQDPELIHAWKKLLVQKFKREELDKEIQSQSVTDQEIATYHQQHKKDFSTPTMARAAMIFFRFPASLSEKEKNQLREKAHSVLQKARQLGVGIQDFGKLSRNFSDDLESKYRGGALNWVPEKGKIRKWGSVVVSGIFDLKTPGDLSPIIETKQGFHLLKLMGRREGAVKKLPNVEDEIRDTLIAQKKKDWWKNYYETQKQAIAINVDKKKLVELEAAPAITKNLSTPPAFPLN